MSVICAKGNRTVTSSGYTNVCFTIISPLKMPPYHFCYFHCSNFKISFDKNFEKKLSSFNFFQISTISQNFAFWHLLAAKWLPKIHNSWNLQKYVIFAVSKIWTNCCFKITNQSCISHRFTKNRPLKNRPLKKLIRHFQCFPYLTLALLIW